MQAPPFPLDEQRRLEGLYATSLLDTPAEDRFDRITRIAQRLFSAPIVSISLIDRTREWFKSCIGITVPQIARGVSIAGHVVGEGTIIVVENLMQDPRFADNPLVTGEPGVRFFAGAPLLGPDGSALGALSLLDIRPRHFDASDLRALRDLAALAEGELRSGQYTSAQLEVVSERLSSKEPARIDPLTRLWNRAATVDLLSRELEHAAREGTALGLLLLDVDQLRNINEQHGVSTGDKVLCEIARVLRGSLRPYDSIGRYGGEEFLALLPGADQENTVYAAERIRTLLASDFRGRYKVTVTIGAAATPPHPRAGRRLIEAVQAAIDRGKRSGGDGVAVQEAAP